MGKMQLNIQPEISAPVDQSLSIDSYTDTVCSTNFTVSANITTTGYIEWVFPVGVVIQGGGVNEALALGLNSFTVSIPGFRGYAVNQFLSTSLVTIELRESEFGTVLDNKSVSRAHTSEVC